MANYITIDGYPITMEYSPEFKGDEWPCSYCKASNYNWRMNCYKCLVPRSSGDNVSVNLSQLSSKCIMEDISGDISPTSSRFLLFYYFKREFSAHQLFDALSNLLSFLKRVWLVIDRQTLVSKMFAFLEFETAEAAENGRLQVARESKKYEDLLPEGVDKIEVNFGRDLFALNTILNKGGQSREICHWNPLFALEPFPSYDPEIEETFPTDSETTNNKAFTISSAQNVITAAPKKMKIHIKQWNRASERSTVTETSNPSKTMTFSSQKSNENDLKERIRHFCDPVLLQCFLCNKSFLNEEDLAIHQDNCEEHLTRVEAYVELAAKLEADKILKGDSISSLSADLQRDRAAERRAILGTEYIAPVASNSSITQSTTLKLEEDNLGAQLMRKMGWREGKGLGKDEQGITDPIEPSKRSQPTAGLGD